MARVYCLAYQFPSQDAAHTVWQKVHDVLENAQELNLSANCMQRLSNNQWCVAIVGRIPPESRRKQLVTLCHGGTFVALAEHEILKLTQLRLSGVKEGNWVVKHHDPGKYI